MSYPAVPCLEEEYSETCRFLYSLDRFGILLGLDNISSLLNELGNPQTTFPVVHVGGSNGKGSTSSMVYGILREAGFTTALYTSPHLNDFRERIRINGALVTKEAVTASTRKIREIYDPERTTFFEFTTAVAFDCIAQAKPDMAVIEVGLGGRLDATNTVDPVVTVITDISREHEDYLGVGIEAIAREKAGIIKEGTPVITGAGRRSARKVIAEAARDKGAAVREFGRDFVGVRTGLDRFTFRSGDLVVEDLTISIAGGHQIKNAAIACEAVRELHKQGYLVPEKALREGLRRSRFPGRFEIVKESPDVIIDGAHTPESMRLLKSTFRQRYPGIRPYLMTGMLREKNWKLMAEIIAPIAQEVVCVAPQGDRALDAEELAGYIRRHGIRATASSSIADGFRLLLQKTSRRDVILVAGSLYMIGPVRRACGLPEE